MSLFNKFLAEFARKRQDENLSVPELVVLEERVLYSASPVPVDLLESGEIDSVDGFEAGDVTEFADRGLDEIQSTIDLLVEYSSLAADEVSSQTQELLIVDTSVENYQLLVDDVVNSGDSNRQFEIFIIDQNEDGIAALSQILKSRRGIDALHLVSHGSDGAIQLGNVGLDSSSLENRQNEISDWKYSLSLDADILIYGCDVAASEIGESFVDALAQLTETDVVSSDDRTGHETLGADWEFEYQIGTIEAHGAFSLQAQQNWQSALYQFEANAEQGSPEGLVIDSAGNRYAALTANHDGTVGDDIVLSILDATGSQTVAPVVVNTTTAGDQKWASIAVSNSADRLVVVWTSDDLSGDLGVFAKVYDTSGNTVKSEFQVDVAGSNGNDATVGMASDGSFVVAWEGSGAADSAGIYAQRFDADGVGQGSQFSVNTGIETTGLQSNPDIAVQSNGEFIIAWDNRQDSDTESEIFLRKFDADGSIQFDGSTGINSNQIYSNASIDVAANETFVIAYEGDATDSRKSVGFGIGAAATAFSTSSNAKLYAADGSETDNFRINETTFGPQQDVTAIIFDDGSTAFSWQGDGNDGEGQYYRIFDNTGDGGTETRFDSEKLYNSSSDTPSPERGATVEDPNDPAFEVWSEVGDGFIVKASSSSFVSVVSGAGYDITGKLVEGLHLSTGEGIGDHAPTFDPTPASLSIYQGVPNGTSILDANASDFDGTTIDYSIVGGDPDNAFQIDSDGLITVFDNSKLVGGTTIELVVAATDNAGMGLTVARTVSVEVNDLLGLNASATITEDSSYVFQVNDWADDNGDPITEIKIETLPSNGVLLLDGLAVQVGQEVLLSDVARGGLVFIPASDSDVDSSFDFRIGDGGAFSTDPASFALNLEAVADGESFALGDSLQSLDGPRLVNTTLNGEQANGKIEALEGGGYVVVWQSEDNDLSDGDQGTRIYQQRYNENGEKLGSESIVFSSSLGDQEEPAVTSLSDGGYLIVWTQQDAGQTDIWAQRFDASGQQVDVNGSLVAGDSSFRVHTDSGFSQYGPQVETLSGGGFVIAWTSGEPSVDSDEVGIAAKTYDLNGNSTERFTVNSSQTGVQRDVQLTALNDNRFVIGWVDQNENNFDVKARVFEAGSPNSGTEFTLSSNVNFRQSELDLTVLTDGRFIATWQSTNSLDGSGRGVFGRLFEEDGSPVGNEFVVNETTDGQQKSGRVVAMQDGGFLAIYESSEGDADGIGIFGRRFDSNHVPVGNEFQVNLGKFGDQTEPELVRLNNGQLVVIWESADGDQGGSSFGTGIYIDRFEFGVEGTEDSPIDLYLDSNLIDSDGSESFISLVVSQIPNGAIVFDGVGNSSLIGDVSVDVTTWDLATLQITPPSNSFEDIILRVDSTTGEADNSDQESSFSLLHVRVSDAVDPISRADFGETTDENTSVEIDASVLTQNISTVDLPSLNFIPEISFDQTSLPPVNDGASLQWQDASGTHSIEFDSSVSYVSDSGSAIANLGEALQFDGTGGGELAASIIHTAIQNEGGLEFWIKPNSTSSQQVIFEWGSDVGGISLLQDGEKVLLRVHFPNTHGGYAAEPFVLVADGLVSDEFNQIHMAFSAGNNTALGNQGSTPDVQLYLNGHLGDQLTDVPGNTDPVDFTSITSPAGIGKSAGTMVGSNAGFSSFEGMIGRIEVYDSFDAGNEVDSRYSFERSVAKVVSVEGANYASGQVVDLSSTARVYVGAEGNLTYLPNGAFESLNSGQTGIDSFSYELRNANGASETVTVNLSIAGVDPVATNTDPEIADKIYGVEFGGSASFDLDRGLLYNATDTDGDSLTVSVGSGPSHGNLVLSTDGTFTYSHDGSATDSDSFTYVVTDGNGGSASATVELHIDRRGLSDVAEFQVNQDTIAHPLSSAQSTIQTGELSDSAVAVNENGDYVIVWHSVGVDGNSDLMMRTFDLSGRPLTDQIEISQAEDASHYGGSVSMDGTGNFVVSWIVKTSSNDLDIYARRFNALGNALGDEFLVTEDINGTMGDDFDIGDQVSTSISMNSNGDFVVVWGGARVRESGGAISHDIYIRQFDANGDAQDVIVANDSSPGFEYDPAVVLLDSGDAIVAWEDTDNSIHFRTIFADGSRGTEHATPTVGVLNSLNPAIAAHSSGLVALSYQIEVDDGAGGTEWDTVLHVLDPSNPQFGNEVIANEFTSGDQLGTDVTFNEEGTILVSWHGESTTDSTDTSDVFARRFRLNFDGSGNPYAEALQDEFLIAQTTGKQFGASLASLDSENFVSVWVGPDASSSTGIFARQFGNQSTYQLTGSIWEDVNGDGSLLDAEAFNNATVKIYREGGVAGISGGDRLIAQTETDASGRYVFDGLHGEGGYWIAVDSKSLQSSTSLNTGYEVDDLWAEQTYGDGGTKFGGLNSAEGGTFDDASSLLTSEHVSSAILTRENANNIDFGFSFNVVTNSDDTAQVNVDSDGDLDRSGQGTLRQFILNANGLVGGNEMRFVPTESADRLHSGNQVWEVELDEVLPSLTDEGTIIDGRSYALDGTSLSNLNSAMLGYGGQVGVGSDGREGTSDDVVLSQLDAPELELSDGNGLAYGIDIRASNTEVRYVSVHGFGTGTAPSGNIVVQGDDVANVHIHHNVLGARANEFVAPNTAAGQSFNIFVENADDGLIEHNLIGFGGYTGIKVKGSSDLSESALDWEIRHNEIRSNALVRPNQDGIDLNYDVRGTTIYGNLIEDNLGFGVDSWRSLGGVTIQDNSILGNGFGGSEIGGIRIQGTDNQIEQNVIAGNNQLGIHVTGLNTRWSQNHPASTQNLISKNAFYDNTELAIDLVAKSDSATDFNQGDGVTLNDVVDDDQAGNLGLNYPELKEAVFDSGILYLTFESVPTFSSMEIYVADPNTLNSVSGDEFGQGAIYLGTLLASDVVQNPISGLYSASLAAPTNGWPSSINSSSRVTTLAMDSNNNTSEFGTTAVVQGGSPIPVAVDSDITTEEDTAYTFKISDFKFTDLTDTEYETVRIESLPVGGVLLYQGNPVSVGTEIVAEEIAKGELVYTPNSNQFGSNYDEFEFSVNDGVFQSSNVAELVIHVTSQNDAPEISPPHTVGVAENQTLVTTVAGTDIDGDALFYSISGGEDAALFEVDSNTGTLSFKTPPDFDTPQDDVFQVVVRANDGIDTVDQEFTVIVTGVNDNDPELTRNRVVVNEGQRNVGVELFDADLPTGTVIANLVGGVDAGLFNYDSTTNTLNFATLPDFENPLDFNGDNRYELQFQLDDGEGRTSVENLLVRVRDVAEQPTAVDDLYSMDEGSVLNGTTVLANDTYSADVFVTLVQQPSYGSLSLNRDGTFTYRHGGDEVHSAEFVYQVNDDSGLIDTAVVQLNITPVDDAPIAVGDSLLAVGDVEVDITEDILANDLDTDSRIERITIMSQPTNGRVFINNAGKLIFAPEKDFDGQTSFSYQVSSKGQASAEAVVVIDVAPPPTQSSESEVETEQTETAITTDLEGVTTPTNEINNDEAEEEIVTDVRAIRDVADSLADTRNANSTVEETVEINLDSNDSTAFASYVYSSDVKISEVNTVSRQYESNLQAVSQFESQMLASSFLRELDAAKNQFYTQFDVKLPSLAMAGTSFLTVGYLAWMVRGGILLTTFMSSVPAWRMLDPLAVLESVDSDDAQDDQSIGQLVDN